MLLVLERCESMLVKRRNRMTTVSQRDTKGEGTKELLNVDQAAFLNDASPCSVENVLRRGECGISQNDGERRKEREEIAQGTSRPSPYWPDTSNASHHSSPRHPSGRKSRHKFPLHDEPPFLPCSSPSSPPSLLPHKPELVSDLEWERLCREDWKEGGGVLQRS